MSGERETVLKAERIHKSFGSLDVLKGVDLEVRRGETVCLIGSSGSGKSTFLRCLNFLEYPTAGRVTLKGQVVGREQGTHKGIPVYAYRERDLVSVRSHVGMVFQQFNLFPHMSAIENVMEGPVTVRGLGRDEARDIAQQNLAKVGLSEKANEYPSRLSGGQQQRVAIARALAMKPDVMLFDEITSSLDPELVGEVLRAMRTLSDEGMTMIVVTHELGFAYHVAGQVLFLHQGVIHEQGTPDQVLKNPQQERTKGFLSGFTDFYF
ncbi:MAG: amino acid ABC transporter ATP-binding protein [Alphaproteobacteria bacterium]|nr:amino acid ABC transporter ATP-binding protein [Alphaproteobacteria bacterium]